MVRYLAGLLRMLADPLRTTGCRQMARPDQIAYWLTSSVTQQELFEKWMTVEDQLEGSRFVLSASFGEPQPIPDGRSDFEFGGYLRGLFIGTRLNFLDDLTGQGLKRLGAASIPIDHSISFDTNAASYATHFVEDLDTPEARKMRSAFDYLISNGLNYDFGLYFLENHRLLLEEGDSHEKILRTRYAIEVLKDLDEERYLRSGEVRAHASDATLWRRADKSMLRNEHLADDSLEWLLGPFEATYLILLKIAAVELGHPQRAFEAKLKRLLEFFDQELGAMFLRELSIAIAFFLRGTREGFFGKVQKNHPKLLSALRNMAWDLQMYRYLERLFSANFGAAMGVPTRHFLPYVLTFDRQLASVWNYYGLRSALTTAGGRYVPLAELELKAVRAEHSKVAGLVREYLMGATARKRKARARDGFNVSAIRTKQRKLESELLEL